MGFIGDIVGGGIGEVIGAVGGVIDSLTTTDEERNAAKQKIAQIEIEAQKVIEGRLVAELQTKERILVAELTQGDNYTKRARPTVVYGGLLFIFLNYVLFPLIQPETQLALPSEFWMAWGGIVATWSVGRSFEKRGAANKAVSMITGNNNSTSVLTNSPNLL